MKTIASALILVLVLMACGLLDSKSDSVSKEQINSDIGNHTVKVTGDNEWSFKGDSARCFEVVEQGSEISDSNANVLVTVAAWRESKIGDRVLFYPTIFGRMMLNYKKEGENWVLENIDPKDLTTKNLETEEFKEWIDITTPTCKYFRHTTW